MRQRNGQTSAYYTNKPTRTFRAIPRLFTVGVSALGTMLLLGCATAPFQAYEGMRRPPTEVATLRTEDVSNPLPFAGDLYPQTTISFLGEGKSLPLFKTSAELLPGSQFVNFEVAEFYSKQNTAGAYTYTTKEKIVRTHINLAFEAEAGHIYETRARKTHSLAYQNKVKDKSLFGAIATGLKDGVEFDYEGQIYDVTTKKIIATSSVTKTNGVFGN